MLNNEHKDAEKQETTSIQNDKMKYPKGIYFILFGYLMERFAYYALFAGGVFYLQRFLDFSASTSSSIKSGMEGVTYLAPIIGAILADNYIGKFRVVFYMSCLYVAGALLFSASSVPSIMTTLEAQRASALGGIFIFILSAGLMKAAYTSLGPEQFILPDQDKQLKRFYYVFFWMVNAGSFLGQLMTGQIRSSVQCFEGNCFALPFLIACCMMMGSALLFYTGKRYYRQTPYDATLPKCIKCIAYCIRKSLNSKAKPVEHWLDRAKGKFESKLIEDVKQITGILYLFIPLPLFWALFFQTFTGMVFLAKRLDGRIGSYVIPPEIINSINPLWTLILIPLLEFVVNPFFKRRRWFTKVTSGMSIGMFLACFTFCIYGVLNSQIEQKVLGESTAELNIHNAGECVAMVEAPWIHAPMTLQHGQSSKLSPILLHAKRSVSEISYSCNQRNHSIQVPFQEGHETTVVLSDGGASVMIPSMHYLKDIDADAKVRLISTNKDFVESFTLRYDTITEEFLLANGSSEFQTLGPHDYTVEASGKAYGNAKIRQDGVYDVIVTGDTSLLFEISAPTSIHILWIIPQFLIITVGDVVFSVACYDFTYSESPESLKSLAQALRLFMLTIGLWIYAFITKVSAATEIFKYRASYEAFFYAVLMIFNICLFQFLTAKYHRSKRISALASK